MPSRRGAEIHTSSINRGPSIHHRRNPANQRHKECPTDQTAAPHPATAATADCPAAAKLNFHERPPKCLEHARSAQGRHRSRSRESRLWRYQARHTPGAIMRCSEMIYAARLLECVQQCRGFFVCIEMAGRDAHGAVRKCAQRLVGVGRAVQPRTDRDREGFVENASRFLRRVSFNGESSPCRRGDLASFGPWRVLNFGHRSAPHQ